MLAVPVVVMIRMRMDEPCVAMTRLGRIWYFGELLGRPMSFSYVYKYIFTCGDGIGR